MEASDKIQWEQYNKKTQKALHSNMLCHTEACGYTVSICTECGHQSIHYGSCNNANCLECGMVKREKWCDRQREKVLNARYSHIIFTVPSELNQLFLAFPKEFGTIQFKAQQLALKEISRDPKYFGAETIGFFSVQHTWGSNMSCHPHIHTLLCQVGLDKDLNLVYPKYQRIPRKESGSKNRNVKKDFLFPAKKLATIHKDIFLKLVSEQFEYTGSPWLEDISRARAKTWQVQICDSLDHPEAVIKYLGRYVTKTVISNSRIKSYDGQKVSFTYKDYKSGGKVKEMELEDTEFLRRFTMHIPPEKFTRIRYYGFLSNNAKKKLDLVKELTGTPEAPALRTTDQILTDELGEDYKLCSKCKGETIDEIEEFKPKWSHLYLRSFFQRVKDLKRTPPFVCLHNILEKQTEKD